MKTSIYCYLSFICLGVLVISQPAKAENKPLSPISRVETELEFAQKMVDKYHYLLSFELADEILKKIPKSSLPKETQIKVDSVTAEVKVQKINIPGLKMEEQFTYLEEATDALKQLIKTYGDDYAEIKDARLQIGNLLFGKGKILLNRLEQETDADVKSKLQPEAVSSLNQAAEYFAKTEDAYHKEIDVLKEQIIAENLKDIPDSKLLQQLEKKLSDNDNILSSLRFAKPQVLSTMALLPSNTQQQKKDLLNNAIDMFEQIMLEKGPFSSFTYQAANEEGVCYLSLCDWQNALRCFTISTTELLSQLGFPQSSLGSIDPNFKEIIQRGFSLKARTYNQMYEYRLVIGTFDELSKVFPQAGQKTDYYFQEALLEKALALYYLQTPAQSFGIIQKVISEKGPLAIKGVDLYYKLVRHSTPFALSPDILLNNINYLRQANRIDKMVAQSKQFLTVLRMLPKDTQVKYAPEVLWILGQEFLQQANPNIYQALIAFEELYKQYGESDYAPDAANNSLKCYLEMGKETNDRSYEEHGTLIASLMSKKGWGGDWLTAMTAYRNGKYLEAVKLFQKASETPAKFLQSKEMIGSMYYLHAERDLWPAYEKEEDSASKAKLKEETIRYLKMSEENEKVLTESINENTDVLRGYQARSALRLAQIYRHPAMMKYSEVLKILAGYETAYAAFEKETAKAIEYKTEALIESSNDYKNQANLKTAELYLEKFLAKKPEEGVLTKLVLAAARKYEAFANQTVSPEIKGEERCKQLETMKTSNSVLYNDFIHSVERSAFYYEQWLQKALPENVSYLHALYVANNLSQAADDLAKHAFYKKASEIYEKILDNKYTGQIPKENLWKIQWDWASSLTKMENWQEAFAILEAVELQQPNNFTIKINLATAYEKAKEWDNALTKWHELHRRLPEKSKEWWNARYHILICLMNKGDSGGYIETRKLIDGWKYLTNGEYDKNKFGFKDKINTIDKQLSEIEPRKQ
ncbi:MAG: hypothetical protein HY811_05935 [Planctomycetes bacterium]|nr:hypothetical protein [Planctomycetota bacterium]